jgi:hypothetical protein
MKKINLFVLAVFALGFLISAPAFAIDGGPGYLGNDCRIVSFVNGQTIETGCTDTSKIPHTPEPATMFLIGSGLVAAAAFKRFRVNI